MSIIATAQVPAQSRLADAQTVEQPRITNGPTGIDAQIDRITLATMGRVLPPADTALAGPAPLCPTWCTEDHGGEVDPIHTGMLAEATGLDPAYVAEPATARVMVESTDDGLGPRVVVTVTKGTERVFPGFQGCQGWTGTRSQAVQLALALLKAAALVRAKGGR